MKYTIHYVENATPKRRSFRTKKALNRFISKFPSNPRDGYWLDFWTAGTIHYLDW